MKSHIVIPFTTVAAALALAGPAAAADRFAEPNGDGANPCTQADPCSLSVAAGFAVGGDTVHVLDGTYDLAAPLSFFDGGVTMQPAVPGTRPVIRHGAAAQPTVRISVAGPAPERVVIRGFAIEAASGVTDTDDHPALRINSTATVSDVIARSRGRVVDVVVDDPGATVLEDARVEQVAGTERALIMSTSVGPGSVTGRRLAVTAATGGTGAELTGERTELLDSVVGGGARGVLLDEGTAARRITASGAVWGVMLDGPASATDSVVQASGPDARAVLANGVGAVQLRNLTAIASGAGSLGLASNAATVTARNVIARGDAADVKVLSGSIAIDHSNFRTQEGATDGGANQSADPRFADAAAGDFRLAPTSPAIDAGVVDDVLGASDRDGASRFQLAAPDLGAYEAAAKGGGGPGGGPGGGGGPAPDADTAAPALRGLAASGKRRGKARAAFTLSESATVTVTLERRTAGKRKGGRCVKPTRRLRGARSCTRFVRKAAVTRTLAAGPATVRVGKGLAAARYRVTVTARDAAGNAAAPARTTFKVKRSSR